MSKPNLSVALDIQRRNKKPKFAKGGKVESESGSYPDSTSKDATDMAKSRPFSMTVTSAKSESRPMPTDITSEEMAMIKTFRENKKPVSSWDERKPTVDDQNDHMENTGRHGQDGGQHSGSPDEDSAAGAYGLSDTYSTGGKISDKPVQEWAVGRPSADEGEDDKDEDSMDFQSISREPVQRAAAGRPTADDGEDQYSDNSVAGSIMRKRKNYANGGMVDRIDGDNDEELPMPIKGHREPDSEQVDIDSNAREDQNHEDDLSFESLNRENYSEEAGLDALDSPMDSNETGDSREDERSDRHDMVDQIRSKMRMRKVGQRYSER